MPRPVALLAFLILPFSSLAQIRVTKLVLRPNERYDLGQSDILVADTLVMMDSSRLVLNKLKRDNFVRVKVAIFGNGCVIDGKGLEGKQGRDGKGGITPAGPCQDGTPGRNGTRGLDGTPGINLFLYLEQVRIDGRLIVDLSGGDGGPGGNGGLGGNGSQGTVHCNGGNGGNGGNSGRGGNGANGGALTLNVAKNSPVKNWVGSTIVVNNYGGYAGLNGRVGPHGSAGWGPYRKTGKDGVAGSEGERGIAGVKGAVNFEAN